MNRAVEFTADFTALSLITPAAIARARGDAARTRRSALAALAESTGLDPEVLTVALGSVLHLPLIDMTALNEATPAFDQLPYEEAVRRECAALRDRDGNLVLVMADPFDDRLQEWAAERVRSRFSWRLAHRSDLQAYFARHEETLRAMEKLLPASDGAVAAASSAEDLSIRSISEDASPVVRLVHSTLYDALRGGASDIHLETGQDALTIKYRIDGVLSHVGSVPGQEHAEQVISRLKVMSELDIAERRVPQDGRLKVAIRGREIDVRVSVMPSLFGEDAVLRILDKQSLADAVRGLRLDQLGFDPSSLGLLRRLSGEPYGMLLVTGPTGSGKTTTLYAAMSEINNGLDKIVTIEDPVEYQLPGVLQIPVNEKKGLTFARGLRSILRHDPDKIMVGEIRDPETAQIAIQSALTGHLVFTTVHANNVFDVIGRFIHMGVDPYSFVSALNGVVAQRLIRLNCPNCSEPATPDAQLLIDSGLDAAARDASHFRAGRGCGNCRGSGFRGRKAIAETLALTDEVREMIVAREPIRRIKDAARANGLRLLRETAVDLVRRGETTLQEINRVTFVA